MRLFIWWSVCAAVLLVGCSEPRRVGARELDDALTAEPLGVRVDLSATTELKRAGAEGFAPRPMSNGFGRRLGGPRGEIVISSAAGVRAKLVPLSGPRDFPAWGPGVGAGDAVVYPSADGRAAQVLTSKPDGVKEDLVFTSSLGDSVRFEWTLEVAPSLSAHLDDDGAVRVRSTTGERTVHFVVPAPVVKTRLGATTKQGARFTLSGEGPYTLALEATGLDALGYPLSIDPSIVVTTNAELLSGNLEANTAVSNGAVELRGQAATMPNPVSQMPQPTGLPSLEGHAATTANGFVYVLGGTTGGSVFSNSVYLAPISAGTVGAFTQSMNSLPTARAFFGAAAFNDFLYVMGGYDGASQLSDVQRARINANGTLGPFTSQMVSNLLRRQDHCVVAANGFLYFAGGLGSSANLRDVHFARLNPDGSLPPSVTQTTDLPAALSGHSCVIAGGKFYVLGGSNGTTRLATVHFAPILPDGRLGPFVATTSFPTPRTNFAAGVVDGFLVVQGGTTGAPTPMNDLQYARLHADGTVGQFRSAGLLGPARGAHAAVVVGGVLTIIGGRTSGSSRTNDVSHASPFPGPTALAATGALGLSSDRAQSTVIAHRGRLYLLGGSPASGLETAALLPDGGFGAFIPTPTSPFGVFGHGAFIRDEWLYSVGGVRGQNLYTRIERAPLFPDGGAGAFDIEPTPLPEALREHSVSIAGSTMYVIGGLTGANIGTGETPRSTVRRAPLDGGAFVMSGSLPGTRWGHATVVHNGKLYVIGGSAGDAGTPGAVPDILVATINADGTLSSFAATTPLPDARRDHVAVAASGALVVFGGENAAGSVTGLAFVAPFLADGGLDTFVTQSTFTARFGQAGAFHDGNLYLLGGNGSASSTREGYVMPVLGPRGMLTAFEPQQQPLIQARSNHASVAADGWLYVLGGNDGALPINTIEYAALAPDGGVGPFNSDTLPASLGREGLAAVATQGRVYVVGGANGSTAYTDVQYASILSDGSLGGWTAGANFVTGRSGHEALAYRGWLYVIGGRDIAMSARSDIQYAPINAVTGAVGPFTTAATSLTRARFGFTAVASDGYLYVIGGMSAGGARLATVEAAPINPDGSIGAFSPRTSLPGGRSEHESFVSNGFLYVLGGSVGAFPTDDVLYAPISSGGQLGPFQGTKSFQLARRSLGAAVWGGRVYVTGGDDGSAPLDDVQVASITTANPIGTFSKRFDVGGRATFASVTVGGSSAARGVVSLQTASAGETGGWSSVTGPVVVPLGTPQPINLTNRRYFWASVTLDDTDAVVVNPDSTKRDVTDLTLVFNPNPQLSPAAASCPPRGQVPFVCSGGSDAGYVFAISTNASMGATVNASGLYRAGPTGGEQDDVQCTDSAGVSERAAVTVGPGVSIQPTAPAVPPRGSISFRADGGDTLNGYTWSVSTNASGAAIDGGSGFYVAGVAGSVTDVVSVVDALGNTAQVNVTVGPVVSILPSTVSLAPGATRQFAADGGDGRYSYIMVSNPSGSSVSDAGDYTAGRTGNTIDAVRVSDSLGNTATATITVTAGVSVMPATITLPPRGAQTFTASGGANSTFSWSMATSRSDGGVGGTGAYVAGPIGNVTDVIQATDALGNVGTATVTVGPGISVMPASPSTAPRGTITFTAAGGSDTGFMFGLVSNQSGANLTDAGSYVAGAGRLQMDGGIFDIDTVRVVDSLGNTLDFTVEVTNGLAITPRLITVPPRAVVDLSATGGSTPYTWSVRTNRSGGAIDAGTTGAQYVVGSTGSVIDEVEVRDSSNEARLSLITVSSGVGIMPSAASVVPREALTFSATGGSTMGWVWSLATNASGGSISPTTGGYVAGNTGGVTDVVQVTDSLGNVATVNVTVGPAITINPPMASVAPLGTQSFSATGGRGSNFTWSLVNRSGGMIDSFTGAYAAGSTGGVVDVVQVRDPLGNTASANVTVTGSLSLMPRSPSVAPNGPLTFIAQGGTPPLQWALVPNRSGGTLDMMGAYRAGPTPSVTDTVTVTDAFGNSASTDVAVGVGVSISPANPTIGTGGAVAFTASGGSGEGYQWTITTNVSGGSILGDGTFTAGPTVGLDTVQVTDSLGNTGSTSVSVISGGVVNQVPFSQRPPVSGWSCGCSTGGDALGVVALALLLARVRRRRGAGLLAVVLVVALPAFAAPTSVKKKKEKPAATKPVVAPQPPAPVVTEPPPPAPVATPPAPAPMPKDGKLSVAVLDVDVTVPNEKLDAAAFSEMLVNSIDGTGMFRVISSKEIATLIGLERQRALLGCSEDSSCMAEIANALGSDLVAQGSVGKVGSTYLVSVRLIDGRTSRTAARANAQVSDSNALLRAVWTSSQEMLEKYGASLPPEQAAKWASRPKQETPTQVAVDTTPNFFGVQAGAVAGYQVLSEPAKRGSIGAQVDVTFQRGRLDLGVGLIIGPNLGVRITATWALIASRFRLGVGLRGAGYPGIGLYGGGPVTTAEFTIVSVWSVFAAGGAEISPGGAAPVLVLLGTLGTGVRF